MAPPEPDPSVPASILITPEAPQLVVGTSTPMTAEVRDQYGALMPGVNLAWGVGNPSVAAISSAGVLEGVTAGESSVFVVADGSLNAQVTAEIFGEFSVAFASATHSPSAWNATRQRYECSYDFSATASGGLPGTSATWTSGEIDVRLVSGDEFNIQLSAMDLLDRFGTTTITTGEEQSFGRLVWHESEDIVVLFYTIRWNVEGSAFSATTTVDCR